MCCDFLRKEVQKMTFIKGMNNDNIVMARSNCSSSCESAEEESCDVATGSGSSVTGDVNVSNVVGAGKK